MGRTVNCCFPLAAYILPSNSMSASLQGRFFHVTSSLILPNIMPKVHDAFNNRDLSSNSPRQPQYIVSILLWSLLDLLIFYIRFGGSSIT